MWLFNPVTLRLKDVHLLSFEFLVLRISSGDAASTSTCLVVLASHTQTFGAFRSFWSLAVQVAADLASNPCLRVRKLASCNSTRTVQWCPDLPVPRTDKYMTIAAGGDRH